MGMATVFGAGDLDDQPGDIITNPWGDLFTQDAETVTNPPWSKESTTPTPGDSSKPAEVSTTKLPNPIPAERIPDKVKVKKATKKKSAKKIKVIVKKVANATGYQVLVFKTKKNAKKLVKPIYKKKFKKAKFTLKSKKFKKKKKLFVRVRAFNSKYSGDWSKVKKVKIKK
jgi:hypothetical protein